MRQHGASDFWAKVIKTDSCWLWTGRIPKAGKAEGYCEGLKEPAYRIAYRLTCGDIPEGSRVYRTCRNVACVNPDHLEARSTIRPPKTCPDCGVHISKYAAYCLQHRRRATA